MNEIQIGLASWIIQDGNYGDFKVGDHGKFALEFHAEMLERTSKRKKEIKRIKACKHRVVAEVLMAVKGLWVVDFGFMAYGQNDPPEGIKKGDWVEAEIYLGIDPFFYFENLHGAKNVPNLFYEWHVERIEMETTPLIETKPRWFVRDLTREGYKDISQTDAWKDDDGNAHYIFHCTELKSQQGRGGNG